MTTRANHTDDCPELKRVVLVGRTPIEAALRKQADVELLRARTATDAIGEMSAAHDEGDEVGAVLIGDGAVDAAEFAGFCDAVHLLTPSAKIVEIGSKSLEDVMSQLSTQAAPAPAPRVATSALPRFMIEKDVHAPAAPLGDATFSECDESPSTMTDVILAGLDPTPLFLEIARRDCADDSIEFLKPSAVEQSGARHRAKVARRGADFGSIVADRTNEDCLTPLAHELASWLALYEQQRQLRTAAFTDQLTGAWNRRYFDYFFPCALSKARELRHDVTLMVYDIDDFKSYNDCYGHAAGDDILRETVRLLISVIRPTDRVCRMGGDEFAVIFDDPTGPRQGAGHHPTLIADIAARFQRQICEHRFPKLGLEAPGTLTISGGMATFPWDGACAESLLEKADQLALQSKRQGKNLITFGPGAARVCGAKSLSPAPMPPTAENE